MARRGRVPKVLWRLFHHRVRTLADTIISLIPPSPPPSLTVACRCEGRQCLGCSSGEDAMSFLLRPDDPSDYRKLLSQCFVVVSDNAPPLSAFCPERRSSQNEIVKRTIEMIMCDQCSCANVICSGYDKHHRSSPIVEILACSAWDFLLRRVGDSLMVYLLKYTSIFLPLPHKKHHQVAGFSISDLCLKTKNTSQTEYQQPSLVGSRNKRKRVDEVDSTPDTQQSSSSCGLAVPLSSPSCFGCYGQSYSTPFNRRCRKTFNEKSLSNKGTETTGTDNANNEKDPMVECQESSNQTLKKPTKRSRQVRWQRRRKRRHLNFQETYSPTHCSSINENDSLSARLQSGLNTNSSLHPEKALQKVPKGTQINRQSMFYKLESSSSVFPRTHILYTVKPNLSGANALLKDIFGLSDGNINALSMPCFHSSNCCLTNSTCLYHSLVKLLKTLIRKAQRGQLLRLLDKHCEISSWDQKDNGCAGSMSEGNGETNSVAKGDKEVELEGMSSLEKIHSDTIVCDRTPEIIDLEFEPSKNYCQRKQVVSFIWAVCRSSVPPDLLGSPSNWRTLRRNIASFVRLRRYEKFSLNQCMHKLKTSEFPLLSNYHSLCCMSNHVPNRKEQENDAMHTSMHKVLRRWIFWFFSCLVVPLVQANFYVTESEHGKQDIFYYRKSVWGELMNRALTGLKKQRYRLLNNASVRRILSKRSFGFSRVRLRPKADGIRALANLKAASRIPVKEDERTSLKAQSSGLQRSVSLHPKQVKYEYFKSVNGVLRDLHVVLKGLQTKEPEKLGSSVFDYNDVYKKLCPFLSVLKSGLTDVSDAFIVVSDVSKAFDSVNQDRLLGVMKDTIRNDEYLLNKSHQVVCTKKSLWVHQNLMLADQHASTASTRFASSVPKRSSHSVLVNQEWSRTIRKDEINFNLNQHVKRNVLQFDRNFYLQDVGIPQGSVLSSLLCSFYYGDLEKHVIFPFLEKSCESAKRDEDESTHFSPKYLLLRFIDDFLFISTSKKQADRFFFRLQRGFREHNCYMNEDKFGINFDVDKTHGPTSKRQYVGEDGISFLQWSGLFINCRTLEIQADYTRYPNTPLCSSLTVCWQGKPGRTLKSKLCDYLRPKCHPIFYDSNINSAAVVRLNIYQAFLLCAMKFHCYVRDVSHICSLSTKSYIEAIQRSFRYLHKLIKKRMHTLGLDSGIRPILRLEKREVEWLGLTAYTRVLKRKQTRHRELFLSLRSILIAQNKAETMSFELQYKLICKNCICETRRGHSNGTSLHITEKLDKYSTSQQLQESASDRFLWFHCYVRDVSHIAYVLTPISPKLSCTNIRSFRIGSLLNHRTASRVIQTLSKKNLVTTKVI